jgi:hypothetical protein
MLLADSTDGDCSRVDSEPIAPSAAVNDLLQLTMTPDHTLEQPFIDHLVFIRKALVIKAGMGKGKTTALIAHLNTHTYESILVASPRHSFTRFMFGTLSAGCRHLNFTRYNATKERKLSDRYLICQSESFHRLDRKAYGLMILDEVESFLYQLTSTATHKDKHKRNLRAFQTTMQRSYRILLMDAFVSNRTTFLLRDLAIPFTLVHYNLPYSERTCHRIATADGFLPSLLEDLKSGKNIFLFSSSHNHLTSVIMPHLRKVFPQLKALEYHRTSAQQVDTEDINLTWSAVQLVAATGTITVGCNFDKPDAFHRIYVFASAACKNLVRDIFQATYRVRHLQDNHLVYYLDPRHYGTNLPTREYQIRGQLNDKEFVITDSTVAPDWLTTLHVRNTLELNTSIMQLESLFQRYLRECNYVERLDALTTSISSSSSVRSSPTPILTRRFLTCILRRLPSSSRSESTELYPVWNKRSYRSITSTPSN